MKVIRFTADGIRSAFEAADFWGVRLTFTPIGAVSALVEARGEEVDVECFNSDVLLSGFHR